MKKLTAVLLGLVALNTFANTHDSEVAQFALMPNAAGSNETFVPFAEKLLEHKENGLKAFEKQINAEMDDKLEVLLEEKLEAILGE